MKEKQLQWHECWYCKDYDQEEKRCGRTGVQIPYDTYSPCAAFRPRDLKECGTCLNYPCVGLFS